ncbi:MAG: polyphosphate kinase 2 family protein [Flavobacteriales bacterium]|nr:polyphosphate kinase 2 family protein [Flavobacteriales bacterium]
MMSSLHIIQSPNKDFDVRKLVTRIKMSSSERKARLKENAIFLDEYQERLYSEARQSLLIVFQAMDAAGKDSTIRAVFSGMNPQGFLVSSFKQPSKRELAHDYLWRVSQQLPVRGRIGVFNRSHYEEVLVCKVHPKYLMYQNILGLNDPAQADSAFWTGRYQSINNFEKHLSQNGYRIIKFFLNVSQKEQEKRFLRRMNRPEKHWKFSIGDLEERQLWDNYMAAYSDALRATSTDHAPWFAIPADDKDYMQATVSDIVKSTLLDMDPKYPKVDADLIKEIEEARLILAAEKKG